MSLAGVMQQIHSPFSQRSRTGRTPTKPAVFTQLSRFILFFSFCLWIASPPEAHAQNWGRVAGTVTEAQNRTPIPGATILIEGTNYGTAANQDGQFSLRVPAGRYRLLFRAVGFEQAADSALVVSNQVTTLDIRLKPGEVALDGITVEGSATPAEAGVFEIAPETIQDLPTPFKDVFRALKVLPGVATNNELSSQYSVRGGGFNENLIFVNGFEVYMPFRPRQGEQEGIGLLNPDMTERITFYTGGFPARYGGKLSSALDVQYQRPEGPVAGSASLSTLDAGFVAGASALSSRLNWIVGVRKARASRFFATQELKGTYEPDYTDVQANLVFTLTPGHELNVLGIWAEHEFQLDPNNRRTFFGTVSQRPNTPSNLQSLWVRYDADNREVDGYTTRFVGTRLTNQLTPRLRAEHSIAYFETEESEFLNLSGSAVLYQVDPGSENPDSGEGQFPIGTSRQSDQADNRVAVETWTGEGRWSLNVERHAPEAGWYIRGLTFEDRLNESSTVTGRSTSGDVIQIVVDSLQDSASLDAYQAGFFVQDTWDALPQRDRLIVTAGLRTDYYSFNDEWTISPRLTARYRLTADATLTGSWGMYYQAPTYRELRGKPAPGETILGALNENLQAQQSMQLVGGIEIFFPQTRLFWRTEAYVKQLRNVISYDIENVRVLYSGENDAKGYTYGLDMQVRGELVPGLESWINYSFLLSRERFLSPFQTTYNDGWLARPTDQRHTFSVYVQDYVPGDDTWKLHLRALFGSGFPYTPPIPGERVGNIVAQVPGERFSARYTPYMRFDMGATKTILITEEGLGGRPLSMQLTAEILNVFDMTNTVAYSWTPDAAGIWRRVPTRLTPRTFNVRLRIAF